MGAQGTAVIDFGTFPGKSDASVAVTGQTGILSGSLVEAWLSLTATADHSADEHLVVEMVVRAGAVVAGTGFTIYAYTTNEAVESQSAYSRVSPLREPRIYGQWTINWVWN